MPSETGISPYQAVFGRHSNLVGAPLKPPVSCQEVVDFCERMEGMDRVLAKTLNEALRSEQARVNAHRQPREHFEVDDWVWVLRPKAMVATKWSAGGMDPTV